MFGVKEKTVNILLNIGVFLCIFVATGQVIMNTIAAAGESRSYFSFYREDNYKAKIKYYLKCAFYIIDFTDGVKFVSRIFLASFLKDAILSTIAPSKVRTSVSGRLIEKVEKKAFDESWIPDNHYERKSSNTNIVKKTVLYDIGQCIVSFVCEVCHCLAKVTVKIILAVQFAFNVVTNWIVSFVFYIGRSLFCATSSIALVCLHITQILLRTLRRAYNGVEYILSFICSLINDASLISIDVIKSTVIAKEAKLFTDLKNGISPDVGTDIFAVSSHELYE